MFAEDAANQVLGELVVWAIVLVAFFAFVAWFFRDSNRR